MFTLPSLTHTASGAWRRAGFELEFTGLTLQRAAAVTRQTLGASTVREDAASVRLAHAEFGEFTVEIDWEFLKRQAASQDAGAGGSWVDWLSQAAERLVPVEVVCPPLPLNRLDELLTPLGNALQAAGAAGTRDTVIAAYGVHINAEAPADDADTLWRYLLSFALLQWWLVDRRGVDMARRISPYVDLYPESYLRELCAGPPKDRDTLLRQYLAANPTRNRALDLLPLLSTFDAPAVQAAVDDPRVKARPAFHYRLPDCLIDEADWSLAEAWDGWRLIDDLAQRRDDLEALAGAFLAAQRPLLGADRTEWTEQVGRWLHDRALA